MYSCTIFQFTVLAGCVEFLVISIMMALMAKQIPHQLELAEIRGQLVAPTGTRILHTLMAPIILNIFIGAKLR